MCLATASSGLMYTHSTLIETPHTTSPSPSSLNHSLRVILQSAGAESDSSQKLTPSIPMLNVQHHLYTPDNLPQCCVHKIKLSKEYLHFQQESLNNGILRMRCQLSQIFVDSCCVVQYVQCPPEVPQCPVSLFTRTHDPILGQQQ